MAVPSPLTDGPAILGGIENAYSKTRIMDPALTRASVALPIDGVEKTPREPLSVGGLTAVVHLYRAEVGRMTSYRQRLDTTTN